MSSFSRRYEIKIEGANSLTIIIPEHALKIIVNIRQFTKQILCTAKKQSFLKNIL